jgi:hypothetical protein
MKDLIIAEIRKIRRKLDKEFRENPERSRARLKAIEEQYKDRVVRLKPRGISKVVG